MWIKLCGNTTWEDATVCADAGADAVGFIFSGGPRRITAEAAAAIRLRFDARIETIGVFSDQPVEEVAGIVRHTRLSGAQLHGDESPEYLERLRRELGPEAKLIKRVRPEAIATAGPIFAGVTALDLILVDPGAGSGESFHWEEAAEVMAQLREKKPLVLAGGLNPSNVEEAIRVLTPDGVDVASGVEATIGTKDATKVRAFVAAARRAASI